MKKTNKLFVFIFLISCFLICVKSTKASVTTVEGESLEQLFDTIIPNQYEQVSYLVSSESSPDYLGYFTGERSGWQPRIKYLGNNPDAITTYVFCLSFHKTAPNGSSLPYTLDTDNISAEDIPDEYYAYAYIIKEGFGRDYSGGWQGYNNLLWDYYITSMAIYEYQYKYVEGAKEQMEAGSPKYASIESLGGLSAQSKDWVLSLVRKAKAAMDAGQKNEFVVPYKPADNSYQLLTPGLIYKVKTPEPQLEPEPQPEPENPKCQLKQGKYYDNNGNEVSEAEFERLCETQIEPKIKITYRDKCTNEHVGNAKMKITKGTSCNGETVKTWTSGQPKTFTDFTAGNYMICDMTNNYSMSMAVKRTPELQEFEMYTNPATCDEPAAHEEKPPTGVASVAVIGTALAACCGAFIYLKKNNKFIKIK